MAFTRHGGKQTIEWRTKSRLVQQTDHYTAQIAEQTELSMSSFTNNKHVFSLSQDEFEELCLVNLLN